MHVGLSQFLGEHILVGNSLSRIHLQLDHVVATLVVLKRPFGAAKLRVDFLKSRIDEGLRLLGHFVFVFVGLPVVDDCQLLQVVSSTLRKFVTKRKLRYSSSFGGLVYGKVLDIFGGCHLG